MQERFIATTCQVNEFFPGIALYLIYKTLKIAWLHIQVVSSNRAPRIERLYFSSTNKDCLSSVFGHGILMRGAGYRHWRCAYFQTLSWNDRIIVVDWDILYKLCGSANK